MGKSVAIVQSNYIPWKGYFDLINAVDEFILFDDAQYTRSDWRNRNRIKTPNGPVWLTMPVRRKGQFGQKIKDTQVSDPYWNVKHWKIIFQYYRDARYFSAYSALFEHLYTGCQEKYLSQINFRFLSAICEILGLKTKLSWSMDYHLSGNRTEKLLGLCQEVQATDYLSGPSARDYIDESIFQAAGIHLRYADYSWYPEYNQLYPPFCHEVSVIDLIFNVGPDAQKYMLRL